MSFESHIINVMSGRATGWGAGAARAALELVEPFYAMATTFRNRRFDNGKRVAIDVGRPVISVGNITTGGTGKTPIVAWIANQLQTRGHRPGILLRGYKGSHGSSDEAMLLEQLASSPVMANANRAAGAASLLRRDPSISCFVLDDGFQHRQIARRLNITLIDATAPFGFGHVLPRGLLREPLQGLRRADAAVITRCNRIADSELDAIIKQIRLYLPDKPVLRCSLTIDHFQDEQDRPHSTAEALDGFAICGIGNPRNFLAELLTLAGPLRGEAVFSDHHAFTENDLRSVMNAATREGAKQLLTTEKDWVKLKPIASKSALPIWRAVQAVRWAEDDEKAIVAMLESAVVS